ncbi:apoptosis inhibitor 5 [Saccoglossus kowalevskii]|uniref:Apoptosis inhibitor 5 n=1 Tax=Saccoglossus kowalevskii TaxID=10224 RepID=A0A1C9TA37_SACKO|nr:PREDICTED: apoptosis inhibitor 5 [Saccoglossus kowalevskii]AOR07008.1 apoptosis inhibitor 5-like protein [Saccoglossus kowalevskii]
MASVEQLYKDFGVLADAKDKANEHTKEYESILSAVKGGTNEKRLAAQFIPRFFKYFPTLAEQAIESQLDLCEDDDVSIRRQAIKELPHLCKDSTEHIPRISDVLTQLLQTEDSSELSIVNTALLTLFKLDAKGTLGGLFSQIISGEESIREHAIKFMCVKMRTVSAELFTKEGEEYLIQKSKEVLVDVTGDEFVSFIKILSGLSSMQTVLGRQQLVDIVVEQADLESEFQPSDADCVDRLMQCVKQALPFFSKNVMSTKIVTYMCDQVIPSLSLLTNPEEDGDIQLEMLHLFAELCHFSGELEDETRVQKVFEKLIEYMPLPPEGEDGENDQTSDEPKLQFSYVECLMYSFHELGRKHADFLTSDEARLKDFRIRLQYFARGCQMYMKQLRLAVQGKKGEELKSEENKIKVVALKVTSNINTLIKDLFHNPPSYKSLITLSWKPIQKPTEDDRQKRPGITPITFDDASHPKKQRGSSMKSRGARQMYQPPSGKFSTKAGSAPTFGDPDYGTGFGNRRGAWRGGGGGRRQRGGWRGGRGNYRY